MHPDELDKQRSVEDHYWWFVGRRQIVASVLRRFARRPTAATRVLDLAAATGGNLEALSAFGRVYALDRSVHALRHCLRRGCERSLAGDALALPFGRERFGIVACLDLLEHLPDDRLAAREILRVLEPGGFTLVTVPAYPWLWSEHDVALSHLRRYTLPRLVRLLRETGFEIAFSSYCISALFPLVAGFRLLQRVLAPLRRPRPARTTIVAVDPLLSRLFVRLLELEARFLRRSSLPFGVSCLVVGRKPAVR